MKPTEGMSVYERDGKYYVKDVKGDEHEMPEEVYRAFKSYQGADDD